MRYASPDARFGMEISADLARKLEVLCQEGRDCETGGILVGYYTSRRDVAVVTDILAAPQDSVRYRSRFQRGVSGLRDLLTGLWRRPIEKRRYYLGEWHSHPEGPPIPSHEDHEQMRRIADGSFNCPEPILLLASVGRSGRWELGVWVYPQGTHGMRMARHFRASAGEAFR